MPYDVGGGGGKAPHLAENTRFSLAMPGEISDFSDPSNVLLLNQMLQELYESSRLLSNTVEAIPTAQIGTIQIIETSLTVAQIQSLGTTPVSAVPGIPGKVNIVLHWTMQQRMGTTLWSVGPTITLQYAGAAQAIATALQITNVADVNKTLLGDATQTLSLANNFSAAGANIDFTGTDRTGGSGLYDFAIAYITIGAKY